MGALRIIILVVLGVASANKDGPPVIKEHPTSVVARRNDPATLNCAATGASRTRWFRNGDEIITTSDDSRSHRVLLPSGSLFFLRVASSRRDSDAGTYWCVASNSNGATRSNNATLTIASLGIDFLNQPRSEYKTTAGNTLRLPCRPPKGSPTPTISWYRDGEQIENSSRITVTVEGHLIIRNVQGDDSGNYICQASNTVGMRETPSSKVTIMTFPWFEERPTNITTASGFTIEMICIAKGTPQPVIKWGRLDGDMTSDRIMRGADNQLIIQDVSSQDTGIYVCEAENEAGRILAETRLQVVAAPVITHQPRDMRVVVGEETQFQCRIDSDSPPLQLWRLPYREQNSLVTANHKSGRISVSKNGSLLQISQVTTMDSGNYYCLGVSSGGGVMTSAELLVVEAYPPPVMGVGPQDISVPPGATITFPCEAVSESATPIVTWWYRKAAHSSASLIKDRVSRFILPQTGALIIKNALPDDEGIYTCRISADTGKVEKTAKLKVGIIEESSNSKSLPAPPSKPKVKSVNDTAIYLEWLPNSQAKENTKSYQVEYWRKGWDEWKVARSNIKKESCLVAGLTPRVTYMFFVRAVIEHGLSFPSPWSDPIICRRPIFPSVSMDEVHLARRRLARPSISLSGATPTSPDSALLTWEQINTSSEDIEGILVYTVENNHNIHEATVLGSSSSSHLMYGLSPHTEYTFFIVPFWKSIEGTPSNTLSVKTPEDVPLLPPSDISISQDEESVLLTWSPLSKDEAQGDIIEYQVLLSQNGSQTKESVQTPWLEVYGLVKGSLYTVQVAAVTKAGEGPFSSPMLLDIARPALKRQKPTFNEDVTSSSHNNPIPDWLIYLLVPVVILISLITLFYVRHLKHKAEPSQTSHSPSVYQDSSLYSAQHSLNMYGDQKTWRPSDSDKDSSLSSTRLLKPNHLANVYAEPMVQQQHETTEPYATTALLSSASPATFHKIPWSCQSDDSGVQVNWAAILPPPPSCPPPADLNIIKANVDSDPSQLLYRESSSSQYDNMEISEKQYEWTCDSTTDHTYELYTHVLPDKIRENSYQTFNSLQSKGSCSSKSDCKKPQKIHCRSDTFELR